MKNFKIWLLCLIVAAAAGSTWFIASNDLIGKFFNEDDPDMPAGVNIDREQYIKARLAQMDQIRGFDTAKTDSRSKAIQEMERSERQVELKNRFEGRTSTASWTPLGPAPIPVSAGVAYSGRAISIAVHPTNANIAYVGTASGGLYRTLNGGTSWTPLMDSALSLSIGSVAISQSDPTTVFVGTGDPGLCGNNCFIGVGVYKITNADTSPVLTGPLNKNGSNSDIFTGRSISKVLVHPTDPNTIFVSTTSGIAGFGSSTVGLALPAVGVYRSTNALSANPTFTKIGLGISDRSITDLVFEPGNPARLYAGATGVSNSDGGVYMSSNALDAVPTFTQALATTSTGSNSRVELTANSVGGTATVLAASGEGNGSLYRSVNAAPFALVAANGFCNPQCFYDIAVAIDPTNASNVYLAGSPTLPFGRSINGGTSFTNSSSGLHVDSQVITVAPSDPNTIYFGSDGGVWKSTNAGVNWSTLNNTTLSATQFESVALHPINRNYSLGGTQDNGTQFLAPDGVTWIRSDGGDGGVALIDQNAADTTTVTAYHTYFNQTNSQIGFSRATTTVPPGDPNWGGLLGCNGTTSNNGMICSDSVLFYAPMVLGPGNPNTLYFGTTRLYRSTNQGTNMTDVSGVSVGGVISAIAIAPTNDDIRLVGTTGGGVFLSTTSGATTMTNITGSIPPRYVGRVAIDPTNSNIAYVALNGYGLGTTQHVWKTTNLLGGTPTWAAAGNGIPDVPVNSFVIDPANPNTLFAGSDIGVFKSSDAGANWIPFSNGLPRVPVFGMAIQAANRILRIGTAGRGMWDYNLAAPASAAPFDYDGDGKSDVSVFRPATGVWYLNRSTAGIFGITWGLATDKITPADYDGDGKTDVAVFRPSEGRWYIFNSATSTFTSSLWGAATDIPTPGDFDGDGKADVAIFRPSDGNWWLNRSTAGSTTIPYGQNGDVPVVGDYDADGKADIAVFRPSNGLWSLHRSTAGELGFVFGISTDKVAQADYDGDGKTDIAVWRAATGTWFIANSATATFTTTNFGAPTDIPTPGDYDGDGKADIAIFRPADGNWWENRSTGGTTVIPFGQNGDKPTQNAYGN